MKSRIVIAFMLLALGASATTKVQTQHFEIADSIRFFEPQEPNSEGYKFVKTVSVDWPTTVNGKKSQALNDFLVEEVFYASHNQNCFPGKITDLNTLKGCVKNWVNYLLHDNAMLNEFVIKDFGTPGLKDISTNSEDYPMNSWYEVTGLEVNNEVGNLVFFVEENDGYYGGAHGMYALTYHAFDAALDRPIRLDDVITNRTKILRLLPKYDKRDKDNKWWKDIKEVDIDNFYIKDGKMVFSFPPYAVGPYSDGQVEVKIPLKTLRAKGLLTSYGKKLK